MEKSHQYRSTESKYKGGAQEMYVTYDLEQKTRGDSRATYPKVKRVYIAGVVKDWTIGDVQKRSGREVHGILIECQQERKRTRRNAYRAQRGETAYEVAPTSVAAASQTFRQVVEIPQEASNVHFFTGPDRLPAKYRQALQNVR